jgi:hypothetical protein
MGARVCGSAWMSDMGRRSVFYFRRLIELGVFVDGVFLIVLHFCLLGTCVCAGYLETQ